MSNPMSFHFLCLYPYYILHLPKFGKDPTYTSIFLRYFLNFPTLSQQPNKSYYPHITFSISLNFVGNPSSISIWLQVLLTLSTSPYDIPHLPKSFSVPKSYFKLISSFLHSFLNFLAVSQQPNREVRL